MDLAITGLGVVSPLGVGTDVWYDALSSHSPFPRETAFGGTSTRIEGARVAEVWDWEPKTYLGRKGHRSFDRLTKFLIVAAKYALIDAGIKREGEFLAGAPGPEDIGVCSATSYGSLDAITELNRVAELEDPRYINPTKFPNTVINAAAGYVSIWEDLRAPNTTVVDGNCGGLNAVLVADTHLANDRARAFIVGGGEVLSDPLMKALKHLGIAVPSDKKASWPLEANSVEVGEGAAFMVMERRQDAIDRDAEILALVTGYGTAFEPPPSEALVTHAGAGAVTEAVQMALAEAGCDPADIDCVIGGESGLKLFDEAERVGLQNAGLSAPVLSPKSMTGETFGGSGAFAIATALAALKGVGLEYLMSPGSEWQNSPKTILIVSLGYYGNASAIVLTA